MAKALLLLRAAASEPTALREQVATMAGELCPELVGNRCTTRVMLPLADDPLNNRPPPNHQADLVLEIKTPPGLPVAEALAPWTARAEELHELVNPETSLALVMHERVFRPCPPQPICYHYLMVRAEAFSPADYWDYYAHYHAHFGLITPGIEGYAQNLIDQSASKRLAASMALGYREITSISEMHMASMDHFMSSPAMAEIGPAAAADEARFVDQGASVMFSSEVVLTLGDQERIRDSYFDGVAGAPPPLSPA